MPNKGYVKVMRTEVPIEDEQRLEKNAALLFFSDEIRKGGLMRGEEDVEKIAKFAFPIVFKKINEQYFGVFNGFGLGKTTIMTTDIPGKDEVKRMLDTDDFLAKVDEIKNMLRNPRTAPMELEGVLSPPEVSAIRTLLSQTVPSSDATNLPVLIEDRMIEQGRQKLKKGLENHLKFKEGVESIIKVVIEEIEREKKDSIAALQQLKKKHEEEIKKKKQEIANEEKKLLQQLENEKKKLLAEVKKENTASLKDIYNRFASTLTRDLQEVSNQMKKALEVAKKVSDPDKDFDVLEKEFSVLQEDIDILRTSVNTAVHEIRYQAQVADQNKETVVVDGRSKEEHYQKLIEEKKAELDPFIQERKMKELEIENYIKALEEKKKEFQDEAQAILAQLKMPESQIEKILIPADAVPIASGATYTLYIPFYAAVFKKGNTRRISVLPPFILPQNLEKVKGAKIYTSNGNIGFNPLVDNLELLFNNQFKTELLNNSQLSEIILHQGNNIMEGTPDQQGALVAGFTMLFSRIKISKKMKNKVNSFLMEKYKHIG